MIKIDLKDFVIELDGLIVHGLIGFTAVILGLQFEITLSYLVYQIIDFIEGEDPEEVQGDIVEYILGLLAGAVAKLIIGW
jgi:hypothetical protein